jgi:flagellar L-ring protein FlgH
MGRTATVEMEAGDERSRSSAIQAAIAAPALLLAVLQYLSEVGKVPDFTPLDGTAEERAMLAFPGDARRPTEPAAPRRSGAGASSSSSETRVRGVPGDILTVVIEIDERAEISNSTSRSRSGSESMQLPSLLGIPQRIERILPGDRTLDDAVRANSKSSSSGDGQVRRNERLTLRVAATVVEVLATACCASRGPRRSA